MQAIAGNQLTILAIVGLERVSQALPADVFGIRPNFWHYRFVMTATVAATEAKVSRQVNNVHGFPPRQQAQCLGELFTRWGDRSP